MPVSHIPSVRWLLSVDKMYQSILNYTWNFLISRQKISNKVWQLNMVYHTWQYQLFGKTEKIQKLFDSNFLKIKRATSMKHTKIEEVFLKLPKYQRTNNVSIKGQVLQRKANDCACPDFIAEMNNLAIKLWVQLLWNNGLLLSNFSYYLQGHKP